MTQSPKRPTLDASKISSEALAKIVESHADVVRDVERAIDESPVVVIGMAQNPHVRKVRKALTSAGIEHRYLEFGSYVSEWRRRLAIKLWSGWPTFPHQHEQRDAWLHRQRQAEENVGALISRSRAERLSALAETGARPADSGCGSCPARP